MDNKDSDNILYNKDFIETINNLEVIYFRGEFKGKLLFHNTALSRMLGLDASIDLSGAPLSQFFSDSKLREKYYNQLDIKGYVKDFIVKINNSKGEELYLLLNSRIINDTIHKSKIVEGTAIDITEKHKLENELKETERKFNLIAENTNDLIAILNKDFEHIYINKNAYNSVLGYQKGEVLGKRPRDFVHPEDLKRVSKSLKKGLLTGELSEEYRIRHKNGDYIWIEVKGKFLNENENIIGAILISRDITKRRETEQKLRESEQKYRNMIEDAQEGVWALDDNENTIFVNTRICEMLGYTKDEMISKNLHSFIPESMEPLIQNNRSRRKKGIKETYELKLLKKDGSIIFTEVSAAPIMDETQKYRGSFAYITDITEEKSARQKIHDSENKYRTLFESSTDGIYSTNMEGRFIEVNQAFLEMIGYSRKEILEMNNRQITPVKWYETEDNNLLTQLSIGESKVYEKEIIHKNGNIVPVSIRFWILQDEQGDPHRIWAIVRDITDIKKMEYKLKEINRLKSEFLRRASHELKTPLVSIKGFSELILLKYSEDFNADIISNLDEINKGCERLQSIINNLLQTSKLESTEFKPKLEREDLSFLINYCAEELHPLIVKREHSLNIEIPDTMITEFEKEEIYDVISNLLINAIKYTPPKGWIDIRAEILEDFIVISIRDNGIGFTEEEKSKIFQQFGKIERYGQGLDLGIDGSGLGLYISKKIVESHGGKIWMESEGRNKGSTFYFSLPLIKD